MSRNNQTTYKVLKNNPIGAAGSVTVNGETTLIRLLAATSIRFRTGASGGAAAGANDTPLAAGVPEYIGCDGGDTVYVSGACDITEMSN